MNYKKIILGTLLLVILFTCYKLYPSRQNITHSKRYKILSKVYEDEVTVTINITDYDLQNNQTVELNKVIHEDYDTKIILKDIKQNNDTIWINIHCDTKWKFRNGTALTFSPVTDETGYRIYNSKIPKYHTRDEKGNEIQNNGAGTQEDVFGVEFKKDVFLSEGVIVLNIKDFYVLNYELKF